MNLEDQKLPEHVARWIATKSGTPVDAWKSIAIIRDPETQIRRYGVFNAQDALIGIIRRGEYTSRGFDHIYVPIGEWVCSPQNHPDYSSPPPALAEITDRLRDFLADRVSEGAGGGWPEVTPDDLRILRDIFALIRDAKWPLDADGDARLRINVHDLKDHEYFTMALVPRDDNQGETAHTRAALTDAVSLLLSQATRLNDRLAFALRSERQDAIMAAASTK